MIKKESFAAVLITLAFFSGMMLTAATSGCDSGENMTVQNDPSDVESQAPTAQ